MIGHSPYELETWVNRKWRPVIAWVYIIVNIADFVVFPILWSILQAAQGGSVTTQWDPLTLKGAGLFHMAMAAILGVAAWSRGQEKIAGVIAPPAMSKVFQEPQLSDRKTLDQTSNKPIQPEHPVI